jgi:hypothetical protein
MQKKLPIKTDTLMPNHQKKKKTCFPKIVFKNEISHTPQVYTVSTNLKKELKKKQKIFFEILVLFIIFQIYSYIEY